MGNAKKTGRRRRRRALSDCRDGNHRFDPPTEIGGGITRQTCSVCGDVSIDLTPAERRTEPALFGARRRRERQK